MSRRRGQRTRVTDQRPAEPEHRRSACSRSTPGLVVRTWDPWIAAITGIAPEAGTQPPARGGGAGARDARAVRACCAACSIAARSRCSRRRSTSIWIACPPRKPSTRFDRMQQRVRSARCARTAESRASLVTIEDVTARMERERMLADSVEVMTGALGDQRWSVRQQEVQPLAPQGRAIVDTLVSTLREQHHNFSVLSSASRSARARRPRRRRADDRLPRAATMRICGCRRR